MFLTGLMPENKVRTSDKKKKKRKVYLPLHYLSQLWFFERSSWTCNPPKRNDNNSNKKNNNNDDNDDDDDRSAFK